jgi:hypothetical protein
LIYTPKEGKEGLMRPTLVPGTFSAKWRTGSGTEGRGRCRRGAARFAGGVFVICAATLALTATHAHAFLQSVAQFGSQGSATGQFQTPTGLAVDQRAGKVFVADSANARIEKFNSKGKFVSAWGWGVGDGNAKSEVCRSKTSCRAGIAGSGAGQLSNPTSVAVDSSRGPSAGDVYVGDATNNVVVKFNANGKVLATVDGSTTPQGSFTSLAGVAVDQSGNLWTADRMTNDIDEFDSAGNFIREWNDGFLSQTLAIAVDSTNDAVYLLDDFGATQRFTLNGAGPTTVDMSTSLVFSAGLALATNPQSGDLYVDHGDHVVIYDSSGTQIDSLSLGATINSQGLAFRAAGLGSGRTDRLYVSDQDNDLVTIYGPPAPGTPSVTAESAMSTGKTSVALRGTVVPLGHNTSCTFQVVKNADFQASGYAGATSVACTPDTLGSGFRYQHVSAAIGGLMLGDFYHFRVVATSTTGATNGDDQTFQAGPGAWAPLFRCPVDDPAMLATDGLNSQSICLGSNSTHGSFTLGNTTTMSANTNLQAGLVDDLTTGLFTVIPPSGGALVADPAEVSVGGVSAVATVESAGVPSNFDLFAGISLGAPIITIPIKIHLTSQTVDLGPNCFIGSDQNPILLTPQNTDLTNAQAKLESFDPDGTPDPVGPLGAIVVTGAVQGDDTFAVPAAEGCGPNGDGSLDGTINTLVGLPSPSGSNHLVLNDASSAVGFANTGDGQQFSTFWHAAFD